MRNRNIFCLLMWLALPTSLLAQGSLEDYQRANSIQEWARGGVYRDDVRLNWMSDRRHAWYRVETGPQQYEFVLVDAHLGTTAPAFDHELLARSLAEVSGQPVDAEQLPFDFMTFADDLSSLRFEAFDSAWVYNRETHEVSVRVLDEMTYLQEMLSVHNRPERSRSGGRETRIEFVNELDEPVRIYWIDTENQRNLYATLEPGEFRRQHTFANHCWLVTNEADEQVAVFIANDRQFRAIIDGREPQSITISANDLEDNGRRRVSPDGRWEMFIRDHNVWLREVENGEEFALSTTGNVDDAFQSIHRWSPDSTHLVVMQQKAGETREMFLIDSAPDRQLQPQLLRYEYNKPGDVLPVSRPRLFHVLERRQIEVSENLFPNPWSIDRLHWWPDSSSFTFLYNQRGHQVMRIVEVDANSGEARTLIDEQCETFFDYANKEFTYYVDDARQIIWMSERSGWNHFYLYDRDSDTISPMTQGEWVVRDIAWFDEEHKQIWFRAGGIYPEQDPYYLHYCHINFDGSGLTFLTDGDGTHEWSDVFAGYFADEYSRVDMPPVTELRRVEDGSFVCTLETADWSELLETGWRPPERFVATGRDGVTPIYGIIVRPTNFDPNRQYPVIERIYAGPQGAFVPKAFGPQYDLQALAELGFIVVQIDGMGTSFRSKAFHDVCWQNLGDAGFPDRILWLQAAAEAHPEMDLSLVGIYGGSAGGQNALRGMLMYPEFYKVGAADCGCHDNRMDKVWWNELWMGWPVGPHYEEQSNVTQAHRLEGHLLLIVGELDRNVDPASTMQVVDALVQADKDFDLLIIPGAGHGAAGTPYARRRQWDFFVRHLHGVEPRWEGESVQ